MRRGGLSGETATGLLGVLLLAVFPLAFHSYSGITRHKYLAMLLCAAACLLICLIMFPAWRRTVRQAAGPIALALCLFAWITLSAFFGGYADTLKDGRRVTIYGSIRYEGLIAQLCYLLFFLALALHPADRSSVVAGSAVALLLYVALTAAQYLGWDALELFPQGRSTLSNYEFQGTIGNIDLVNAYLTLIIPLLLLTWILENGPAWLLVSALSGILLERMMEVQSGLIAMTALALMLAGIGLRHPCRRFRICIALSGMFLCLGLRAFVNLPWLDGGALGLRMRTQGIAWMAGAAACIGIGHILKSRPGKAVSRRTLLISLAVILVLAALLVWLIPFPAESGWLYEAHEVLHGRAENSYGSWRIGVWRLTLQMSREHLLFGTGPDTFYYAFADWLAATGEVIGETFDNPHNVYLGFLASSGLPALLLYLALLAALVCRCLKRDEPWAIALAGSIVLYSIQAFFSFSLCLVSPMFYALLGMAAQAGGKRQEVYSV